MDFISFCRNISYLAVIVVWLRGWSSNDEYGLHISSWLIVFMSSVVNWTALVGFYKSQSIKEGGVMSYLVKLFMQLTLLPFFCLLEFIALIVSIVKPLIVFVAFTKQKQLLLQLLLLLLLLLLLVLLLASTSSFQFQLLASSFQLLASTFSFHFEVASSFQIFKFLIISTSSTQYFIIHNNNNNNNKQQ